VAGIAHLAAGILLQTELDDGDGAVLVGHRAVDADNGGALKSGRDTAVEILLAGDMELIDHDAVVEHGDAQGDVEGLFIEFKRGSIIHLVGADGLAVDPVDDLLFGLELHQGGAIVLAELREGRPHVAEDLRVIVIAVAARRAAAKELFGGEKLLMDFQPGFKADGGEIFGLHLFERLERGHRVRLCGFFQVAKALTAKIIKLISHFQDKSLAPHVRRLPFPAGRPSCKRGDPRQLGTICRRRRFFFAHPPSICILTTAGAAAGADHR